MVTTTSAPAPAIPHAKAQGINESLFVLENVSIGTRNKLLLHVEQLQLPKHKLVAFIGPNGAGKSTLLHGILNQNIGSGVTLSGSISANVSIDELSPTKNPAAQRMISSNHLAQEVDQPDKNYVQQHDNTKEVLANRLSSDATELATQDPIIVQPKALIRQGRIAWVGQHERFELPLTALEYALLGVSAQLAWYQRPNSWQVRRAQQLLEDFELTSLSDARVTTLSGGEQQRLAVVRALMQQTEILLFDEPTNHLDIRHQRHLLDYLQRLVRQQKKSIIVVLHDLTHAYRYCDEVVLIHQGRIIDQGTPKQVMTPQQLSDIYQVDIHAYDTDGGRVFV